MLPDTAKVVVVALVVVAFTPVKFWRVDEPLSNRLVVKKLVVEAEPVTKSEDAVVEARVEEAVERSPFRKARVVEVACSLVPSLVNIQGMPQPAQLLTVRVPTVAVFALSCVVEAIFET